MHSSYLLMDWSQPRSFEGCINGVSHGSHHIRIEWRSCVEGILRVRLHISRDLFALMYAIVYYFS